MVGKYGVLPEQYADFATLRGDPSDGLPGVAGVGDKTAATLLQQYGDLAGIMAAVADPASPLASGVRGKIRASLDYLAVAPTVVAVATDVELPAFDAELHPLSAESVDLLRTARRAVGSGRVGAPVARGPPALTT